MFKKLFQTLNGESDPGPEEHFAEESSLPVHPTNPMPHVEKSVVPSAASFSASVANSQSFDAIYESAAVKPPRLSFGIMKVAAMAASPHLAGMAPELKRNSILMALDAANAEVAYLLEDAVFRQRALNEREESLQNMLNEFEAAKSKQIAEARAELARITALSLARIQANLDEIAVEQEKLRTWQARKELESQRIAETAMYLVPKTSQPLPVPGYPLSDGFATLRELGAATSRR